MVAVPWWDSKGKVNKSLHWYEKSAERENWFASLFYISSVFTGRRSTWKKTAMDIYSEVHEHHSPWLYHSCPVRKLVAGILA
jgi:hypothetical protein